MASIFKPNPETGGRMLNPKFVLYVVVIFTVIALVFFTYFSIKNSNKDDVSEISSVGVGNMDRAYSKLLTGEMADKTEDNERLREYADSIADPIRGQSASSILRNMQDNMEDEIPVSNLGDQILSGNKNSLDSLVGDGDSELSGYVPFGRIIHERIQNKDGGNSRVSPLSLITVDSRGKSARELFYEKDIPVEGDISDSSVIELEESVNGRFSEQEQMLKDIMTGQEELHNVIKDKEAELKDLKANLPKDNDYKISGFGENSMSGQSVKNGISANSVPTGTNIPVVLLQDVVSTTRSQHIWVQVAQEVTFRNQVQLPKGVRIRGSSAGSIREMVDITFDLMVFPDGTELEFDAVGINGFDPRFPNMYKLQGVTGKYIVPPVWTKLLPIFIESAIGYSDNNREYRQPQGDNTVINGEDSGVSGESSNPSDGPDDEERGYEAVNSAAEMLGDMVIEDLQRYQPYVRLNRGQSFFVQTGSTVDFSLRSLGGRTGTVTTATTASNLMSEVTNDLGFTNQLDLPNRDAPVELPNGISNGLRNSIESYLSE
jgi:hypothetical protein